MNWKHISCGFRIIHHPSTDLHQPRDFHRPVQMATRISARWMNDNPYSDMNRFEPGPPGHHSRSEINPKKISPGILWNFIRHIKWTSNHMPSHDDVIQWKHFPHYWPFVRGIHRSPVNSHTKASDAELWFFFDQRLSIRLSKQSMTPVNETPSRSSWRHCDKSVRWIHYPFPNFKCCTVEVWEWISTFIPHFVMAVIINPCWYQS